MKSIFNLILIFVIIAIYSCGGGNSGGNKMMPTADQIQNSKVVNNSISRSLPTMMVIPSDALLNKIGCLTAINNQGKTSYLRMYDKAFIVNSDLRFVIANIEGSFANVGYPIENMEQQLRMITNENAMDQMENIDRDLRAQLMSNARPDLVIEIDYEFVVDPKSRNLDKSLTYIIKVLDVFTNKAIGSVTRAGVGKENDINDIPTLIKQKFPESIEQLQSNITSYYANLLANGTEITLRVAVKQKAGISLDDLCGKDVIGEQIINWLKENTINSSYKMVKNTSSEMRFTNIRIFTSDENGNSYTAYDFAKDLKTGLHKGCGLDSYNRTQSIGDAFIQINGIK